jgi:protein involved in polysaccharide export with SLBB domain
MYPAVLAVRPLQGITINIPVDDVSLNSTAAASLEAQTGLLTAGAIVVNLIEKAGGLTFSADKAQLISNDDELARTTAALMGLRHGCVERSVRKLGYDYTLKPRGVHPRAARGNVVKQRIKITMFGFQAAETCNK